jgi:predicted small lipoprotein YifL
VSRAITRVLAIALLLFATLAAGCGRRAPNATPEGAVREFVERMRRVQGDPADAKAAFEMLSVAARANLKARADRYSAASGKAIAPEAMIVPSLFLLRFDPQRYRAKISGTYALVEAQGLLPEERAQIPCIFEEERWRLDLPMPLLSPIQTRPRDSE